MHYVEMFQVNKVSTSFMIKILMKRGSSQKGGMADEKKASKCF